MALDPPRRSLLAAGAAGAAALLAGCSGSRDPAAQRAQAERAAPARRLRQSAARQSAALLGRYDATTAAHPALAGPLAALRGSVAAHLRAVGGRERAGEPPSVPAVPADAVAALVAAERRTADARTRALGDAPPELARLLASLAAAGGVHVYLLGELDVAGLAPDEGGSDG
ncbi:hypothetical protein QNO07_17330 [Streptomyces sp. 549]|uniref:hypothetical protein n=1 Tax=Streptomyces sp. 549 TaxID=3049076 RepID=UPI0024C310AA|nr:hypothetical protein [Streptomyces sp. 549]MDK1475156.1 hypothetical protein [Streptomyces sp. 549]